MTNIPSHANRKDQCLVLISYQFQNRSRESEMELLLGTMLGTARAQLKLKENELSKDRPNE